MKNNFQEKIRKKLFDFFVLIIFTTLSVVSNKKLTFSIEINVNILQYKIKTFLKTTGSILYICTVTVSPK